MDMSRLDKAAAKLEQLAARGKREGGLVGKLAENLRADADFLRRVKPRLVKARLKGTKGLKPATPSAPNGPQLGPRHKGSPYPLLGAALAVGVLLAKVIDWRGHAHPRR